jgi:uncharacterized protein (TIGR03083 family)
MLGPVCGTTPILCAHLLRRVDGALIELLRSLAPEEWDLPTIVPAWRVRDVAAHLLDTALRKLSVVRDGCLAKVAGEQPAAGIAELVNRLNREGVAVYGRLSPAVLIELMQVACDASATFHERLDPFASARFAVSWAGEMESPNWFDTARELTERWHHQQQIRLAANRPGIMTAELYHPVLDCFLRGLPFLFRDVDAAAGTTFAVEIAGDCGGTWILRRSTVGWAFADASGEVATSRVRIPQEIAWRIFTREIERVAARSQVVIEGDATLGERVLSLTAIVA